MTDWFARPVLHVTDVDASVLFYVDRLGFTSAWRYDEDGRAHVAQVERQGCALILADSWPQKIGKGLMFISLNFEPQMQIAALDALRAELEAKGVPVKEGSWVYRLLVVDDPEGNQLFQLSERDCISDGRLIRRNRSTKIPLLQLETSFTLPHQP
jgi:catechol 2,3-dioxygenase-like lactoylglutathione lyase family enzyme